MVTGPLPHNWLDEDRFTVLIRGHERDKRKWPDITFLTPDGQGSTLAGCGSQPNMTASNLERCYLNSHFFGPCSRPMIVNEPSAPDGKSGLGSAAGITCMKSQGQGTAALQT